jgi:hypothetical protein
LAAWHLHLGSRLSHLHSLRHHLSVHHLLLRDALVWKALSSWLPSHASHRILLEHHSLGRLVAHLTHDLLASLRHSVALHAKLTVHLGLHLPWHPTSHRHLSLVLRLVWVHSLVSTLWGSSSLIHHHLSLLVLRVFSCVHIITFLEDLN